MYAFDYASLRRARTIRRIPAAAMKVPGLRVVAVHSTRMAARKAAAAEYAAHVNQPLFFTDAELAAYADRVTTGA